MADRVSPHIIHTASLTCKHHIANCEANLFHLATSCNREHVIFTLDRGPAMDIQKLDIPGLLLITPRRFGDERGFFSESWNRKALAGHGVDVDFVQDNHSLSKTVGTVRGLHFQAPPHAQAKLVRCGRGRLFDVAVDARKGSPTFGKWFGVELSFDNGQQLLIPEGFLHGFMTLEPDTEIIYKCSDYYAPECDGGVRFDDPEIGIDWPLKNIDFTVSAKDRDAPSFADFNNPFSF